MMHIVRTPALSQKVRNAMISVLMAVHPLLPISATAEEDGVELIPEVTVTAQAIEVVVDMPWPQLSSVDDGQLAGFRGLGSDVTVPVAVILWDERRCCTPPATNRAGKDRGFDAVQVNYRH